MKKESKDQTILSDEALAEIEQRRQELPAFEKAKIVDDQTPFMFMTQAIQKHLKKTGNKVGGGNFGYIVNLFDTDKTEFKKLLTEAGYTVQALPKTII